MQGWLLPLHGACLLKASELSLQRRRDAGMDFRFSARGVAWAVSFGHLRLDREGGVIFEEAN